MWLSWLIWYFVSFIHSSTHSLLSFPPISFLLNQLCFSFKFVESFLSCILQDGISGDDVPPLGGGTQRRLTGQEGEKSLGPRPEPIDSRPEFLEGTKLLDTLVRFGKISFKKEDVRVWDRRWKPSGTTVRHLSRDWMFIPLANVRFVVMATGGISYSVQPQSICSWASVLCCLKLVWDCLAWIYSCILWILIAVCEWLGKKIDGWKQLTIKI